MKLGLSGKTAAANFYGHCQKASGRLLELMLQAKDGFV